MPAALVYRYLDAKNRLLGLTLGQAFAVGAVTFLARGNAELSADHCC